MKREDQMKFHEMQAYWWMHSASNGHAKARKLYHGFEGGPEFTDQEKVNEAMETAQGHMRLFMELAEKPSNDSIHKGNNPDMEAKGHP